MMWCRQEAAIGSIAMGRRIHGRGECIGFLWILSHASKRLSIAA